MASEVDILRSDAGVMTPEEAARNPVYGVLSGPSGGVAGALYVATRAGYPNILTFDMGGTSTDVSLCQAGEPTIGRETTIGQFRIKIPSIDVHTVGAGGGSIAHVPELTGALRVGPESAGAEPGPAAYGRGGTAPTVTDANVVVGHLPPRLIGGEMELDVEAARTAVGTIADAMGLSLEEAAEGILKIVNENMAGALRVISVQRGHDPREFALVAFGGAGPLHANAVAELMGSFPVIVPPSPGLLCALGDLVADFRNEFARTLIRLTADASGEEIDGSSASSRAARASGWTPRGSTPTARRSRSPPTCATTARATRSRCRWRATGTSRSASTACTSSSTGSGCRTRRRRSSTCARSAPACGRTPSCRRASCTGPIRAAAARPTSAAALRPGNRISGPAVITEFDSTTVVLDGLRGRGRPLLQHPDPAGGRRHEESPRSPISRSTRSRSTSSRTRSATRASRWTPCCSAAR